MKTAGKVAMGVFSAVILGILGAILYIYLNLNSLIKTGVETAGPRITRTEVRLGSSNISIFNGTGELKQLFIGNPEGFKSGSAFELDAIKMAVDVESVTSDVITIKNIHVSAPKITYEVTSDTSNIKALTDNVRAFAAPGSQTGAQQTDKSDIRIIINEFVITDGNVTIFAPVINKEVGSPLPDIRLRNIGKDRNGITVGEASLIIMEEVENAVLTSSANPLDQLRSEFGIPLEGKGGGIGDQIKQKGGEVMEGIKGLFK
jgi:hypothetical protein